MKNFFIITVANPWCDWLISGYKTMELRRKVPNLKIGDIIFICRKGFGTEIVGAFQLLFWGPYTLVDLKSPRYKQLHRVDDYKIERYANGGCELYGLHLARLRLEKTLKIEDFGYIRNPQCFNKIKTVYWHNIPEEMLK